MSDARQARASDVGGFPVVQDLSAPGPRDLARTVDRLGELLSSSQIRATFQLRFVHDTAGDQTSCLRLVLDAGKATTSSEPVENPDVEIITTPDTWWEIATGKLAPHDAFRSGRMRLRGSRRIALSMLNRVAASPGGRTHLRAGEP
jgi:putative sterol carrier protein